MPVDVTTARRGFYRGKDGQVIDVQRSVRRITLRAGIATRLWWSGAM